MPRFRLLLKAEYALLFLAVLCFGVTVVFRAKAAKTYVLLDEELQTLCQSVFPSNLTVGGVQM